MIRILSLGRRFIRPTSNLYRKLPSNQLSTSSMLFYANGPSQAPLTPEDYQPPTPSSSAGGDVKRNLGYKFIVSSGLDEKINAASSPENLFDVLEEFNGKLSAGDVILTFEKLVEFKNTGYLTDETADTILKTERYEILAKILNRQIVKLEPPVVLRASKCLLTLFPEDDYLMESLEQHMLWLLPRIRPNLFVQVLEMHYRNNETPSRRRTYDEALKTLDQRWVEIMNPRDIVTLMYQYGLENSALMTKLEERAVELCDKMNWKELYRIMYILSKKKSRNTPLLKAILYHMNRFPVILSPVQLQNLMYACSLFKLYDQSLFEKVSETVRELITERPVQPSVTIMTRLLTSFSVLRWRDTDLLDAYVAFFVENKNDLSEREVACLFMTLANLNYQPKDEDALKELLGRFRMLNIVEPRLWLSVVWSQAILGIMNNEIMNSVLDHQFITKLLQDNKSQSHHLTTDRLKLHNINCAAQLLQPNYTGATLTTDFMEASKLQVPVRNNREMTSLVIKALSNIAPMDKYLKSGVMSSCACYIDAEMLVNNNGEPQPITDQPDNDFHRLAIRVYEFPDLTLKTPKPIGLHALTSRLLSKEGYKVIEVPYYEFKEKNTVVKQVQYLEEKIKNAIKPTL